MTRGRPASSSAEPNVSDWTQAAFDGLPQGICVVDRDLTIHAWNECLAGWTKIPQSQAVGQNLGELYPHLTSARYAGRLNLTFSTGSPTVFSSALHGSFLPISSPATGAGEMVQETLVRPLLDHPGMALVIIRDVTASHHQMEDIRRDRGRLRLAEKALRSKICDLKLLQRITTAANEGCSQEAFLRRALMELCEHTQLSMGHVFLSDPYNSDHLIPARIWHAEDLEHFASFRQATEHYVFRPGDGLPGRVLASGRFDWSEDLSTDTRCPRMNQAAKLGLKSAFAFPLKAGEQILGVMEFFTTEQSQINETLLELFEQVGTQIGLALDRLRAMDDLTNQAHELQSANIVFQELMEAADVANQSKSEFLANMSHELRTPLTAILGYAETLAAVDCDETQRRVGAETILRNGNHLLELLSDILDLSKIEAGKMTLERIAFSPLELTQDVLSLMKIRSEAKGLSLKMDFPTRLPKTITSDPTRIRQVLLNLVGNAIKFTEVGEIQLRLALDNNPGHPQLRFDVLDTGIGLSREQIGKLFQPFTQADTSTTRGYGGTGLGLTICKRMIELLGGSISVESELGRGSQFTICVPVSSEDAREQIDPHSLDSKPHRTTPPSQTPITLPYRILVVEDGIDNQRLISFVLKKAGATVRVVNNGQEALDTLLTAGQLIEPAPCDVVLMDMQMPVMDGYTATQTLRAAGFSRPIIALTARTMKSERAQCLKAGCDAHAPKPINRNALAQLIHDLCEGVMASQADPD